MTTRDMIQLVARLLRPYRAWVALVLLATLLETGMSLAAPWPLKIILDNVLGEQKLPHFLRHLAKVLPGHHVARIAALAAVASVLVAAIGALASYVNNYYTENIGQWVANDLRLRLYDHLEHLSLTYHHRHRSSALLSTLIEDIDTIQDFASSKALNILVDLLAVTGMLCLMLYLNWDFALIATAVAPVMLLVVARLRKEVKKATREVRNRKSEILGVLKEGLEEIRMVHALGLEKL